MYQTVIYQQYTKLMDQQSLSILIQYCSISSDECTISPYNASTALNIIQYRSLHRIQLDLSAPARADSARAYSVPGQCQGIPASA